MNDLCVSIFQPIARDDQTAAKLNWLDMAANRASGLGSRLLICPELSLTGYRPGDGFEGRAQSRLGEYFQRVAEIALLHDIAIVFGYPEAEKDKVYNAVAFVDPEGKLVANHRKNHIPPGFETGVFTAGEGLSVFAYAGWRMALLICYDIEFPEAARQAALLGAEFLIVPTALDAKWPFIAEKIVPARAWENGVFLAYANWAGSDAEATFLGGSRIIGPDGIEDAVAGSREAVLTAVINKARVVNARAKLPYLKDRRSYE